MLIAVMLWVLRWCYAIHGGAIIGAILILLAFFSLERAQDWRCSLLSDTGEDLVEVENRWVQQSLKLQTVLGQVTHTQILAQILARGWLILRQSPP